MIIIIIIIFIITLQTLNEKSKYKKFVHALKLRIIKQTVPLYFIFFFLCFKGFLIKKQMLIILL